MKDIAEIKSIFYEVHLPWKYGCPKVKRGDLWRNIMGVSSK